MKSITSNLKVYFKNYQLLIILNRFIKSKLTKIQIAYLKTLHQRQIRKKNLKYSDNEIYRKNSQKIREIQGSKAKHKILWIGANKDQDEYGILNGLKESEIHLYHDSNGKYGFTEINPATASRACIDETRLFNFTNLKLFLKNNSVTIIIGQMWGHQISEKQLLKLKREYNLFIINLSMDDRLPNLWFGQKPYIYGSVGLGNGVDLTLTTCKDCCEWFLAKGMDSIYFPLASDPKLFRNNNRSSNKNILFVGNNYGYRDVLIKHLLKNGIKVECYGSGWENGPITYDLTTKLTNEFGILLGIGFVGQCKDISTLKQRDFDSLISGNIYITNRHSLLEELFIEDKEIIFYDNFTDCVNKLKKLQTEYKSHSSIGKMARKKCMTKHTWSKRLNSLFNKLGIK